MIGVDPRKYDAVFYEEDEYLAESRIPPQNVIRWKETAKGEKMTNTKIVTWSNGSKSLMIGSQLFDLQISDNHQFTFLFPHHPSGAMIGLRRIEKKMRAMPYSGMRRKGVSRPAKNVQKQKKIQTAITIVDPEEEKKKREEEIKRRQKAQRDERMKRQNQERRQYHSDQMGPLNADYLGEDLSSDYDQSDIDDEQLSTDGDFINDNEELQLSTDEEKSDANEPEFSSLRKSGIISSDEE